MRNNISLTYLYDLQPFFRLFSPLFKNYLGA